MNSYKGEIIQPLKEKEFKRLNVYEVALFILYNKLKYANHGMNIENC